MVLWGSVEDRFREAAQATMVAAVKTPTFGNQGPDARQFISCYHVKKIETNA